MSSSTTPKTVLLSGSPIQYEAVTATGSTIKAGELVETTSTGELQEHSTAGGNAQALFAREADYVGGGIDAVFKEGDTCPYYACNTGDRIYAFATSSQNITAGALLESAGNGALRAHVPQAVDESGSATYSINTKAIVGKALEAVTTDGTTIARIKIEVI